VTPAELRKLPDGHRVEIRWAPGGPPKLALFVRLNGAGNPVLRVERVDHKGRGLGTYGAPRVFLPADVVRKVRRRAGVRACRRCGCTDDDCRGCIERTGRACYWAALDLCSACLDGSPPGIGRAA
jgi:hypothetical protein